MEPLLKIPTLKEVLGKFSNVAALVFDMDGTLLNSEVLHAKALHVLLEESENIDIDYLELLERFKGVSEPDVLQMLIDMKIVPMGTDIEAFILQKNDHFEKFLANDQVKDLIIDPLMVELLKEAKTKKLKLAIVTASERSTTNLFVDRLGIRDFFDFIITRDDTEKTKPDPMPYLHSFKELMIDASNALIFEDSETGYAAAVASGGQVQKVCWYDEKAL